MNKNLQELVGNRVEIGVSDPWEFESETGVEKLSARVLQIGKEGPTLALLLQVEIPVKFKSSICEYFIASPRHKDKDFMLLGDVAVPCGLTLIPRERAESENPFDLSWWRGGIGLIGGIKKI